MLSDSATKINWSNQTRQLSALIPAEYNPRILTQEQAQHLKASLDKFQLVDPIIINANNRIIGGHQRYFVLMQAGGGGS